jgi:hypothetical protein
VSGERWGLRRRRGGSPVAQQVAAGAEIVQERWKGPVDAGTRLRHSDGLVVEYLEHRPADDDVPEPGAAFA